MLVIALFTLSSIAKASTPSDDQESFLTRQRSIRKQLSEMLGIPHQRVPLAAEKRGEIEQDGILIEKWIFTSEPGSRVPAVLYRPKSPKEKMPAIVLTYGHGCSKSQWAYNYAGQLYAKLGLAVLAIDPLGEEERSATGKMGTREHDDKATDARAAKAGRMIMGKLVFDTMRGIDFLLERDDIDPDRIGVVGHSLGGAAAGWMAALDPRVKMAIVCGWAYDDVVVAGSKSCTRTPNQRMRQLCSWTEYASLAAPHCAVLLMNGDADWIIDQKTDGQAWKGTKSVVAETNRRYGQQNAAGKIEDWYESEGGHRPYFLHPKGLAWIHEHLGTPGWTTERIQALPTVNAGRWCDAHGIKLEKLYGTPLHDRGATIVDLKLAPMPRSALACLRAEEMGATDFTIEGWLDSVEGKAIHSK
jgi:dienelactone hydrolase